MALEKLSVLFSCKLYDISAHSLPELTHFSVFCVGKDLKDFSSSLKSCDVNDYVCDRVYLQWESLNMFFLSKKIHINYTNYLQRQSGCFVRKSFWKTKLHLRYL